MDRAVFMLLRSIRIDGEVRPHEAIQRVSRLVKLDLIWNVPSVFLCRARDEFGLHDNTQSIVPRKNSSRLITLNFLHP